MDLALYDPEVGYYARAVRRSGRAGDFFTSVDVGPLFGELIEIQLEECWQLLCVLRAQSPIPNPQSPSPFDLVEAGAGNGRLAADILAAARHRHAAFYESIRLHLVEASAAARAAQRETLGVHADRLVGSSDRMPESFEGVLVANELLDAMPVHQVVMRDEGLREIYVDVGRPFHGRRVDGARADALHAIEGPPSTPDLGAYLARAGVTLEPGWRAEINLRGVDWVRDAARRLSRGFVILIDYGHQARELYSEAHSLGTLTSYAAHRASGPVVASTPPWLLRPGEQDITAHVDFTSIRAAAEAEGMTTIAFVDQTYFVLGLLQQSTITQSTIDPQSPNPQPAINLQSAIRNPQLKTLVLPGGLGSTQKVLILGKGVGAPALGGASFSRRAT